MQNEKQTEIWNKFLGEWPLSRVEKMNLEEYTKAGSQDSFTYWIESKLDILGSIWGGSSFKFGIYSRDNKEKKKDGRGRSYSDHYAWYSKYGNDDISAFNKVKEFVVEVIKAIKNKEPQKIDSIDLGESYKWKIASVYQDRNDPQVLTIFMKDALLYNLENKDPHQMMSRIYAQLLEKKPGNQYINDYSVSLWQNYASHVKIWKVSHGKNDFTSEEREKYLEENKIVVHKDTGKNGGDNFVKKMNEGDLFYLCHGNDEGIKLLGKITSAAEDSSKGDGWKERRYEILTESIKNEPYNGIKKGWSPNYNSTCVKVEANDLQLFNNNISIPYFGVDILKDRPISKVEKDEKPIVKHPQNIILYGPPGTGKTYSLVNYSLALLDKISLEELNKKSRKELMQEFHEKMDNGQIEFITFHQSFSYEDFIEGIKPKTTNEGTLIYEINDGVFKRLVIRAKKNFLSKGDELKGERNNKYTITRVNNSLIEIEREDGQIITLPFNFIIDLFDKYNRKIINDDLLKRREVDGRHIQDFLDVKYDKYLFGYNSILLPIMKLLEQKQLKSEDKNFVVVIDEINRGNVANIFGEIITLIEDDKRENKENTLSVQLPYSKSSFSIPDNIYILGTMNTADRSVEALDTALRRRFSFIEMSPFPQILNKPEYSCKGIELSEMLSAINDRIEKLLDKDYCIGHSYFMNIKDRNNPLTELKEIFQNKIIPLLQEYFYGNWEKIQLILGGGFISIKDGDTPFLGNGIEDMEEIENKIIYEFTKPESWTLDSFRKLYEKS
ncbi:MAG: McrB family protein [Ignavibacteriaceae bacterium]